MRRLDINQHVPYLDVRFDPRLPKADQFTLLEDIEVAFGNYTLCSIPAGFLSDGASVPPWLWSVAPSMDNRVLIAYIVHDFLYCEWETYLKQQPLAEKLVKDPRWFSDKVMLELMNMCAPESFTRNYLYYLGVRLGGQSNWNGFRREAKEIG